jgi:hypothetical protein
MGREDGEHREQQDDRFAGYSDKLLPPTSSTIDTLAKLIHKQAAKGQGTRMWNHVIAFEDGETVELDRCVRKEQGRKIDLYQLEIPNGAKFDFLDDDDLYEEIKRLEQSDEDQAELIQDYKEIAGLVVVNGEERAMTDDDWRMLGTFINRALRLDKRKLLDEDVAVVRGSVIKQIKHYLRDYGAYTASRLLRREGEDLGLVVKEELTNEGEHKTEMLVVYDVEVADTAEVDRTAYTIDMKGEVRSVRIDRYRKERGEFVTENPLLMETLDAQADVGLDQPTQEDFEEAIALIERFTNGE